MQPGGGIYINFVPREGGNTFTGSLLASFANDSLQGTNLTERLRGLGMTAPDSQIKENYDVNPAPIPPN